ncbi:MAG: proton extrusion protein PcxA [Cyanobacteria bacterium P01_A01_bin.84]
MKKSDFGQQFYSYLVLLYKRYLRTPQRSLDEAYKSAQEIKAIEDQHFNGKKINYQSRNYSHSAMKLFEADLKKHLKNVRMRLTEFKSSRFFINEFNRQSLQKYGIANPEISVVLDKLEDIDKIVGKYRYLDENSISTNIVKQSNSTKLNGTISIPETQNVSSQKADNKPRGKTDTTGLLPRSILSTINRLQVELDPNAEEDVVKSFRNTQRRTIISVRFILLLIIVPILTHQLSKVVIVGPLVDHFRNYESEKIFLNYEMEERALVELGNYKEKIIFENLISNAPSLSEEEINEQLKDRALEVAEEYRSRSGNAVKNVFADIFSAIAFMTLLYYSKSSIAVLKDFFDHVVYGLSDSAKAFIIILFTDIFVGFHSPHGWEIVLEGISRHWGLPANHDFIFLFIATFPVILDTIFKYWIFRYLNRISPSAVATYHNMNEG